MDGLSDSNSDSDIEELTVQAARAQKKRKQPDKIDLQALQQHGYKSGPSVLYVPAPKQVEQSWEWYAPTFAAAEKLILLLQVSTHSYVLPGAQEIKQVLLEGMMMLRLQR